MSNSKLISGTFISPNKNSPRNHSIDRITPHCYVAQASIESAGNWFGMASAECSCNYMIGPDGRIGLIVDEKDRSWCSSSPENDHRAVTFEVASDTFYPYAITDAAYKSMIKLMTDICKRNGKDKIIWFGDKEKTLAYEPKSNEMVVTVHRWFAAKECPGEYIYSRLPQIVREVNALLGTKEEEKPKEIKNATDLNGMSEADKIKAIAPLYQKVQKETGMLASVGIAQFCLESGYGTSDLAQKANNLHGMKCNLSGNSWSGSTWDGNSRYTKDTKEQDINGKEYTVKADFRKYQNILDSIRDRAAYFIGAMNGSKKRYPDINQITNAENQVNLIKSGVYATDVNYVSKLMSIINRFDLTQYDNQKKNALYRVQLGYFESVINANALALKLRKNHIDCLVSPKGNGYMIQSGAYSVEENAQKRIKELKKNKTIKKLKINPFYEEY